MRHRLILNREVNALNQAMASKNAYQVTRCYKACLSVIEEEEPLTSQDFVREYLTSPSTSLGKALLSGNKACVSAFVQQTLTADTFTPAQRFELLRRIPLRPRQNNHPDTPISVTLFVLSLMQNANQLYPNQLYKLLIAVIDSYACDPGVYNELPSIIGNNFHLTQQRQSQLLTLAFMKALQSPGSDKDLLTSFEKLTPTLYAQILSAAINNPRTFDTAFFKNSKGLAQKAFEQFLAHAHIDFDKKIAVITRLKASISHITPKEQQLAAKQRFYRAIKSQCPDGFASLAESAASQPQYATPRTPLGPKFRQWFNHAHHLPQQYAPDAKAKPTRTNLIRAVKNGQQSLLVEQLDQGANPNTKTHSGLPILSQAICLGFNQIARLLINHPQIDINAQDGTGLMPLDWALAHTKTEIAQLLRSKGAKHSPGKPWSSTVNEAKVEEVRKQPASRRFS